MQFDACTANIVKVARILEFSTQTFEMYLREDANVST